MAITPIYSSSITSDELRQLNTLCIWKEATKPNGWLTKEIVYDIRHTYKKELSEAHPEIEKDILKILKAIQSRAQLVLAVVEKIFDLIT